MEWADRRTVDSVRDIENTPAQAVKLLAHMALAEELWYARLVGRELEGVSVFPDDDTEESARKLAETAAYLQAFINDLDEEELDRHVSYKTTSGDEHKNLISGILTHLALHGSYHRGQIAAAIRGAGGIPAVTDFIVYLRDHPEKL